MTQNGKIGLLLIIFGIALYIYIIPTFVEQYAGIHGAKSGRYFPYVLSFLTVLCGGIMLAFDLFEKKLAVKETKAAPGIDFCCLQSALIIVVLSLVYIFTLSRAGYILSTMLALPLAMWFFGYRKVWTIVVLSIVSPLVIYLVFAKFMAVPLPVGSLFQ